MTHTGAIYTRTARTLYISVASFLSVCLFSIATYALTPLSEGYSTKTPLTPGTIVSLVDNASDEVEAADSSTLDTLLGVVINDGSSLLSLQSGQGGQAQIATTGTLPLLVSDINGEIKRGDHITASPVKGVGMKATANVRVIGIAQGNMTSPKKQSYKAADGSTKELTLGEVGALVNVAYYFKEPEKTIIPAAVQNIANSLAGREVGTVPILVSAGIFLVMLIIVSSIIYSMIRSSIISVGRNPLSQSAIYRDLIQLSGLVLAILAVGLIAIYMVLTRL